MNKQSMERVGRFIKGYIRGAKDTREELFPLIEQLCKDLNDAHNELLAADNCSNFSKYDWPEWSPQANSIRWAEQTLKKRLAKTSLWSEYPDE